VKPASRTRAFRVLALAWRGRPALHSSPASFLAVVLWAAAFPFHAALWWAFA